tara:strand:- start:2936 stop:4168 length:1233 start_codon:yes stop_codon:yes gene_type:complete
VNIAFVFYDHPGNLAGPTINMYRLLPELVQRGHHVTALILYSGTHSPAAKYLSTLGVVCRTRSRAGQTQPEIRWILKQLNQVLPSILVSNLVPSGLFASRWAKQSGIITLTTVRSDHPFHRAIVEQFCALQNAWQLSGVVCVSKILLDKFSAILQEEYPRCVIPSGVPVPEASAAGNSIVRIVYLGRMEEEAKRISLILNSFKEILKKSPETRGQMIGSGAHSDRVQEFIKNENLEYQLEFTGPVDQSQVSASLSGASAILLLSEYEGLPGALMDGMACGLVPIVSDIPGGVSELVQHEFNGLVVEPNPEAVVAAVKRLKSELGLWERLSANARQTIQEKYSLKAAADRWEQFAAELIAAQGEQSKKRVKIPLWFNLPPVHPAMSVEDRRYPPFREWISPWFRKIFPRHS